MGKLLGIDPGLGGAIAIMSQSGELLTVHDMPTVRRGKRNIVDAASLALLVRSTGATHAFLEDVHSMPRDGHVGAFSFGRCKGVLEGVLAALGVPLTAVAPATWKAALRVSAEKDQARARASQLLPGAARHWPNKGHDGRAEAALIGLWGCRSSGMVATPIEW